MLLEDDLVALHHVDRRGAFQQAVIVLDHGFLEAALEALVEVVRRVGRGLLAEQVERDAEVEVHEFLQRRHVDRAGRAHAFGIVGLELVHHLAGALDHAAHAGLADEHVVAFLGQHELTGPGQRIEAGLGERGELVLAVAVGEVGEHEERQPVRRLLVERAQDAGLVGIAGMALQHRFRLLAPVAAEIGVQQVDHRPQMPAFLDIDLEDVAEVVERRAGEPEHALLLDRGGLGIALGDDQPPQRRAVLARHLLPDVLALVLAEGDLLPRLFRVDEDSPAVVGHLDEVVMRPSLGLDADRGAQIDVEILRAFGAELVPPAQELGLPRLQRALQPPVVGQVDIVGDPLVVVDRHGQTLRLSYWLLRPVP